MAEETKDTPVAEGNGARVLLVDDDKFLVDMYSMKLTAHGYQVQACLSAHDALEAVRTGFSPDAIVFDLVMPEQDGFSFVEELKSKKLADNAATIALTNQSNDSEKQRAESLGVDRYIVKASMIPSEVVGVVGEEIGKKKK